MEKYLIRAKEILDAGPENYNEKEFSTCIRRMTRKEQAEFNNYLMVKNHSDFLARMKNDLNFKSKVIASYVRGNMEDFHCKHLSNAQMKELNPLIRNAIYTALKDIESGNYFRPYMVQMFNLPEYWEDCEYVYDL